MHDRLIPIFHPSSFCTRTSSLLFPRSLFLIPLSHHGQYYTCLCMLHSPSVHLPVAISLRFPCFALFCALFCVLLSHLQSILYPTYVSYIRPCIHRLRIYPLPSHRFPFPSKQQQAAAYPIGTTTTARCICPSLGTSYR